MAQVSVIIPTWNRAGWVTEAVSSVLAQTFRDFELLVVDDGSDDDTLEALAPFYRRLKLLRRSRRRGVSAARNLGIAVARGQWLICQTEELWIRNGRRVNPPATHRKVGGHIFLPSLQRCMVSPSAVMLHRRLLEEVGTFDEALPAAEDYDFWLRLTWRYPVGLLPGTLVVKRGGHPDQLSRQWGLDRWRIRALVKILEEPELPELYRQAAARTLAEKCTIYVRGCEKRGKFEEAAAYRRLLENEFKGLGEWVWEKGQGLKPLAPSPNEYLPQPDANGQRRAYGHL